MKPCVAICSLWSCVAPLFLQAQPAESYFPAVRDSAAQVRAFYLKNADEIEAHANRLFNQGNFASALAYYDRLISVQPLQGQFYFERARCLEELKATEEALADYNKALELNPYFAEALFNRAHLRFQQGLYGFVIADLDQLLALPDERLPATNAVYFTQSHAGVLNMFSMHNRKTHAYRLRAKAREKTGNLLGAIEDYTAAIGDGQMADAELYYARGVLYRQLGNEIAAQADFQRALWQDPQHHQARLALGIGNGQVQKHRLQVIIAEQPDNAVAFAQKGLLLLEEKQYAAAIADFDSAEQHGYREAALYLNRGIAKQKMLLTDAALADFSKALSLAPSAKGYNLRANCYFKKGNYEKAVFDYTQSLAIDAAQPDVYYNRGIALYYARRSTESCRDLQTAISMGNSQAKRAYEKLCR
ncbi:MAG: tetratricopeptide repeat protein [Cytophagales bacterium]|nr:tetratricopeptide repeat protein [Bernardetiaceae bacterium]MDW8205388.1 tetratricopeptide repeat protein [Cytophagales bacterium]